MFLKELASIMMTSSVGLKVLALFLAISVVMAESQELSSSTLRKLAKANNEFALNLYQRLTREKTENALISPLSISSVLAMLLHGAKGDTRKEIRDILGFEKEGLSDETVQGSFKKLMADVFTKNMSSGYTLKSAGRILVDKSVNLLPNFKDEVEKSYNASISSVDFKNKASEILQDVNSWVDEQTHGKIQNIISEVDPDWVMILMNAIYFKGLWKTQFKKSDTEKMPFHNHGKDSETKVDTMTVLNKYLYSEGDNYQALRMPYETGKSEMLIVLPKEKDGLPELAKSLKSEKLNKIISDLRDSEVNVHLPKFKFEIMTNLKKDLHAIGWKSLNGGSLDLSGMTKTEKKLTIDQIFQKAFIEVNEEGTEAAAVTFAAAVASSANSYEPPPPKKFFADRPFLFFIMSQKTDLILFMGQVTKL